MKPGHFRAHLLLACMLLAAVCSGCGTERRYLDGRLAEGIG